MNKHCSNCFILSEKMQIVLFLIYKCNIDSVAKIVFLSNIIYFGQNTIISIDSTVKKYGYFNELMKGASYEIYNYNNYLDIFIILDMLKKNCYINIVKNDLLKSKQFEKFIDLPYLSNKLKKQIETISQFTDETLIDEVIKYAKN